MDGQIKEFLGHRHVQTDDNLSQRRISQQYRHQFDQKWRSWKQGETEEMYTKSTERSNNALPGLENQELRQETDASDVAHLCVSGSRANLEDCQSGIEPLGKQTVKDRSTSQGMPQHPID